MRRANRGAFQRFGKRVRRRLLWSFLFFGVGAASTWHYQEDIFRFVLAPAGGSLSPFGGGLPVFTAPTEMMRATILLAMRGGALAALPVMVVGAYTLVRPALSGKQHRFIVLFVPATALCFLAGSAFAYFVMLPTGLGFLLNFWGGVAVPLISVSEYLDMMMSMMFWLGVVFELPVAMYLLARTNIIPYRRMRNLRKFVPVSAFTLSAIITPTFDVFNQTLVAVPIIALYEVGLFFAWAAHPERGNYLWLAPIGRGVRWVWRRPRVICNWMRRLWRAIANRIRKVLR